MAQIRDVVEDESPIAVHVLDDGTRGLERRDDDRHLVPHANLDVVGEPVIRFVHDLIDRKRRDAPRRIRGSRRRERGLDPEDPGFELFLRPRVERRKGTHDPAETLRDDEIRVRDDEQRRPDHRQREMRG